jgi:hypothetical protein
MLGLWRGRRYVGERAVDLANTVELPDHVVLDASVFYRRGPLAAQVNLKNLASPTPRTSPETSAPRCSLVSR